MTTQQNGNAYHATNTDGANGHIPPNVVAALAPPLSKVAQALDNRDVPLPDLDASKLTINKTKSTKTKPQLDGLVFGANTTDHMLIMSFDPLTGWSAPEIKPYGPLTLDPACSVFQYCSVAFEGMKAYMDPQGRARLFRPDLNMARFARSAERAALPAFDKDAFLILLKRLVELEKDWIPTRRGYSLYIRPTIIGTRPALGVAASTHCTLYVILSPTGPYFPSGIKPISILSSVDCLTPLTSLNPDNDPPARSWPGGTGEYKLGINYAPAFEPQREAAKRGYEQVLWVLDEQAGMMKTGTRPERRVTEMGQMNFFCVVRRDDGDVDLITPRLDGTILPGVTRSSIITLATSHSPSTPLSQSLPPGFPSKIHVQEITLHMSRLVDLITKNQVLEVFGAATAAVVTPIGRIGYEGRDLMLPVYEGGLGPIGRALFEHITDIQEGRIDGHEWSVLCAEQ